jgi:hypothetical protein
LLLPFKFKYHNFRKCLVELDVIFACPLLQKSLFSETSTEGLSPSPIPALDDPGGVPLLSTVPPSEVGSS